MTIFRSNVADITIPEVTLWGLVADSAQRHPDRVALADGTSGRTLTYRELDAAVARAAGGLRARGVTTGDVVAVVASNSVEWLVAALAVIRLGGALTGANPGYVPDELAAQLGDSGARLVLTDRSALATVAAAVRAVPAVEAIVLLDDSAATGTTPDGRPVLAWSTIAEHGTPFAADAVADLDLVCALPYSSGTTGRSKGVRLTHRTLVANICQVAAVAPVAAGDRVLAFLPLFHIMGFAVVALGGLVKGATVVTLPGFEPETFLRTIEEQRITNIFVVPPVANFLVQHPLVDAFDLSSLDTIGCGAAPLGADTEAALRARIGCRFAQGYGMTESNGCISYPQFADPETAGASGRLLPNTEAMIVDPATGRALGPGETGEFRFRGPQVFAGYLGNPEATAETIDGDGWVHSGDLGHIDATGRVYITDRLKELIKVKGFQVAPAELEAALLAHPHILDAAVIGRPDDRAGERPVAYVVGDDSLDTDELMAWMAARVSEYKRLAAVVRTDAIPRNPSGKILRRVLRTADEGRAE
ncbi:MAG: AMP-binding protein [Actinomycetota bacterium]